MVLALRDLAHRPAVIGISLLCLAFFGLYGPVDVAPPLYVSKDLHASAALLGGYWTAFAVDPPSDHPENRYREGGLLFADWEICTPNAVSLPFPLAQSAIWLRGRPGKSWIGRLRTGTRSGSFVKLLFRCRPEPVTRGLGDRA
ncbi:MAG: hypothetical protein ACRENX_13045 [Candidatus Dormibacteria bacterium]